MTDALPFLVSGPRWTRWPLWVSIALLIVVFGLIAGSLTPIYYVLLILVAAPLLQRHQAKVSAALQRIPGPNMVRFAIVGYAAVAAEETIVGTIFAVQEGFTLESWSERVSEFVLFNVFAFTGLIWGLAIARRMFAFGTLDAWLIAGGFGLFAENIGFHLVTNPIAGLILVLPTMVVYSVIFGPVVLSTRPADRGTRTWRTVWRAMTAWAIMFALSIAPVAVLGELRTDHPGWFPECDYIACP